MTPNIQELGLDRLSLEDRVAVAQQLWDSIAQEVDQTPLTQAQRQELERRLADSIARPDAVAPWEEIIAKAMSRANPLGLEEADKEAQMTAESVSSATMTQEEWRKTIHSTAGKWQGDFERPDQGKDEERAPLS